MLMEPRRQALIGLLWKNEMGAGDLARAIPDVSFSAVSQHLARLRAQGVVQVRREGRRRFYTLDRDALGPLRSYFEELWGDRLLRLKALAEREERESVP